MSHHLVFGLDRVPDPWQPTWQDGELLSSADLQLLEDLRVEAIAYRDEDGAAPPVEIRGATGDVVARLDETGWRITPILPRGALDDIALDEGCC